MGGAAIFEVGYKLYKAIEASEFLACIPHFQHYKRFSRQSFYHPLWTNKFFLLQGAIAPKYATVMQVKS
jgi:hypothetical protein